MPGRYVFDIETDGLLDDLTKLHCLVIRDLDTGSPLSLHSGDFDLGLRLLEEADLIVGHNVIGFDIPAIQKLYPNWKPKGVVRDTMILTRLLWADIKESDFKLKEQGRLPGNLIGRHSLESWGYRLGDYKGDYKGGWASWSPEMQAYCEQDVQVTTKLWERIQKRLSGEDGDKVPWSEECVELEHSVAWIITRQERHGFAFDEAAAAALFGKLMERRAELEKELLAHFPPKVVKTPFTPKVNNKTRGYVKGVEVIKTDVIPFNPASRQHVAERLQALGWEPKEFGKDGTPTVDDEVLQALPYPQAKVLAELFMVDKRLGALATGKEAWLKKVKNGRIHGRVVTNGAVTGRMTHLNPNMAQVPSSGAPYGKECRGLFRAGKGKVLVGCDADALELRDLAGYMARHDGGAYIETILKGDKKLGTDMHTLNAKALGCDRDTAKTWFYAFIYGAGDYKLGATLGVTGSKAAVTTAGKASRARFLAKLPALGKIVEAVRRKVASKGYLIGLDGRKLRIRSDHAALNTLLQSAGAIQMKRALVILDDALQAKGLVPGRHYEFVANVHDEWQIEVDGDIAEEVGTTAAEAIRLAGEYYGFRCPLAGNYSIGRTWAETH